jgi:hypothetical protein
MLRHREARVRLW